MYYLNDDNIETENKFDHWSVNNRSAAEYYEDTGNLTSASLLSGASGKAVGGLNLDGNGKKIIMSILNLKLMFLKMVNIV